MLNPENSSVIANMTKAWPLQHAISRSQRELMAMELHACFGGRTDHFVREAYRMSLRCHLEELLLGKLDAESWKTHMVFDGQENLDAALEHKKGAIILFPHAGNFMMMIASVSLAGYPYTQYAARGLAPEDMAEAHPKMLGHNRLRESARKTREANEDRLPANFITMNTPIRHLYRCLADNEVVGIAFDGRIGSRFVRVPYLNREALISPGPYRLAASTGAAIVPTFCSVPREGPNVCTFGSPIFPDKKRGWRGCMEDYLYTAVEPWIRSHRSEYALWLAHCRERAAVDDHPFFIDYAPDDRYKRFL